MPQFKKINLPEGGTTLTYSTVDNHDIKMDYYLPPATSTGSLPAMIYYHGGGMTAGSRRSLSFPHWLYAHCQKANYIFISADYRLVHPTTTADQIHDAKALFTFLTNPNSAFAQALPANTTLDPARIAVSGFSAGAYSARAACIYATPKPAALLSVYGLGGDLLLDHWTEGRPATSIARFVNLDDVPALLADRTVVSDDLEEGAPVSRRFALTVRWELDGTMLDGCLGVPGLGGMLGAVGYGEREGLVPVQLRESFLQFFVGADYPPSVFVHGTEDEVVLPRESVYHHRQLREAGVESELFLVEGGAHGLWEFALQPEDESVVGRDTAKAYDGALAFVDRAFERVGGGVG
ncbi:alpha/beta-hydrolase, partial [Penicillium nucicola]|uniref:alpha/beta-hydrolase n=1 Tax=Penicillium nucicola TaxID=1850975 RepID=UPI00254516AC